MRRATKYVTGSVIPEKEILKRFKDEDGEFFLEVRGMTNVLFRVTDGDRVYYKIDKEKMKGEELTLVEDYSLVRAKSFSFRDVPTAKHKAIEIPEDEEIDLGTLWGTVSEDKKKKEKPEEKTNFEEGEKIPGHLRHLCTKNDYGGYTFRYNKFLYMLNKKYRVEIKNPDTTSRYKLEAEELQPSTGSWESDTSGDIFSLTDPITEQDIEAQKETETKIELQRGDILPPRLRPQCEAQLGYGYGSRITIGEYLYLLDPHFKVIKKMKISYEDGAVSSKTEPTAARSKEMPADKTGLALGNIVAQLVNTFKKGLDTYHISADYFKDSVLKPSHHEVLIHAYQGDLQDLNDDTHEAAAQGISVKLPESETGFNLLKAVLIHELYIKSTVSGRGDNMKYFLTHIVAAQPDGTEGELQDNLPVEDQKKVVDFFKNRAHVYTDKTDIIRRVHIQIRNTVFHQYKELWLNKENIRFIALLICKLYESTTRLDRGDGITMIRLTRDLLDYPAINN